MKKETTQLKKSKKLSVLFVSSEVSPFAKVGGLADVVGTLPKVISDKGCDIRVIMPFYRKIKEKYGQKSKFLRWSMIKSGWRTQYSGIYSYVKDEITYYFIDNEYYFGHDKIYVEYTFDIERFFFFQRAVLEAIGEPINFTPDIIHCNDWQAGMIPCLLNSHYKKNGYFKNVKTLLTIHNLQHQGITSKEITEDLLDLPMEYMNDCGVLFNGSSNSLKAGIVYSDAITTVSPTYAKEILTNEFGEGLNGVLSYYSGKLRGILNGIDYTEFNPENDPYLPTSYSVENYKIGKKICKENLIKEAGLNISGRTPLAAIITRLVDQKGADMFIEACEEMLKIPIGIIVLGTGDPYYEKEITEIAERNPKKFKAFITFDNALAHRIYAGADMFLMPSVFEPCGLSQLISMRYGTVPIVRETGGLKDTVEPYNEFTGEGTGFSFQNISSLEFEFIVDYAAKVYKNKKEAWDGLIRKGMTKDFSWAKSAEDYLDVYKRIIGEN